LEGKEFSPDGRALEKVNVIVGAKGSGKSHLAKVILLGSRGSSSGWSLRSGAL
jgi:DNA helicase HerA-like ATPase